MDEIRKGGKDVTRMTLKKAKEILYSELLGKAVGALTDSEIEMMVVLRKDRELQEIFFFPKEKANQIHQASPETFWNNIENLRRR